MPAAFQTHLDNEPLVSGTHKGPNGSAVLRDPATDFYVCGVIAGLAIYKVALTETEATYLVDHNDNYIVTEYGEYILVSSGSEHENGTVTARDLNTVTADGITSWQTGDTYEIYKTGTKDSFISRIAVDRHRGKKVVSEEELNNYGWFREDEDLDRDEHGNIVRRKNRPFGPGQPENPRRRYR